ncbi:MAG: glutamate-5-semialdehyde dehydrogenase [Clostridia bacterium]|nr:glutamate-5-semialdehyde dehydrogenase [Clostridia bacterium]
MDTVEILKRAASVKGIIAGLSAEKKNEALKKMAEALVSDKDKILKENEKDIERSRGVISEVMIDRLRLTPERIDAMAKGILDVAALPDPVGRVIASHTHQNGMVIEKTAAPMGVVAIIYESRPNVTSDAAALALKSSNVCVLRGGKEAYNSAYAIVEAMRKGLLAAGLPREAVSLVEDTTRESARVLMEAVGLVDLLIPRGGAGLIRACVENARVPCIQTGTGICHIFVDASADFDKALSIIENAKTSRPSVCNAEEVLLVHKDIADKFLPEIKRALVDRRIENGKIPVELRLDSTAAKMIDGTPATDEDFDTEFLDYILAVGVVSDVDGAIEHISRHSTGHSEAIITESQENADKFTKSVDSAALYVNASTRFTDGGEFGLGCEMGISTQKLHARGPMGISELTTYKYIVHGNGQVR